MDWQSDVEGGLKTITDFDLLAMIKEINAKSCSLLVRKEEYLYHLYHPSNKISLLYFSTTTVALSHLQIDTESTHKSVSQSVITFPVSSMHLNHTVRAHRPPLLLLHGYPFTAIVAVLPSTDIHTSHQVHCAVLIYLCLSTSASIIIYVHTWPQPNQRTTPPAAFSAYSTTGASTTTWHSPQKEPSQKRRLGNNNKNISILMDILWAPQRQEVVCNCGALH